ncbi:MBL fold metallo-hydrolase [Microvirga sp. BT688]|nr:MBL fold metallo-hydrolase [Microvirga sp.]
MSWAALRQDEVDLTFVGHATFLIGIPQGVRIATDDSDGTHPRVTPDVATMNKAHSTHFSYVRIRESNMCSRAGTPPEGLPSRT